MIFLKVELEKSPWIETVTLPANFKMPNGMLPVTQNKMHPPLPANYLANELQQLKLDEPLQCLSSSASSQSSDSHSPPDTPTDPAIAPHGPGRGGSMNGGSSLPPGLPPPPPQELFTSCSVPYTNQQYPVPQFANRSLYFSQTYRPPFPTGEIIYPFPYSFVPVPYSSGAVPQSKVTCYNCGLSGHVGPDCKESTIEEITQKRGYQLDYKTPPPEPPTDKPHSTLQ